LEDLLTASVVFLVASSLFVIGVGLDVSQIREQQAEALLCEPAVAKALTHGLSKRWLALVLNVAGGVVTARAQPREAAALRG
jgi:hypothetical protein